MNYTLVEKELWLWDKKKQKEVRKSAKTKNEHMRDMLKACVQNNIKFRYVLADIWYGSAENMNYIAKELKRFFLIPLKTNRKVALSSADKANGLYQAVSELDLEQNSVTPIYVEGLDFPLHLTKLIFKNEDDYEAVVYLVTNDLTLDAEQMAALYQKRWSVEIDHPHYPHKHLSAHLCSYLRAALPVLLSSWATFLEFLKDVFEGSILPENEALKTPVRVIVV